MRSQQASRLSPTVTENEKIEVFPQKPNQHSYYSVVAPTIALKIGMLHPQIVPHLGSFRRENRTPGAAREADFEYQPGFFGRKVTQPILLFSPALQRRKLWRCQKPVLGLELQEIGTIRHRLATDKTLAHIRGAFASAARTISE